MPDQNDQQTAKGESRTHEFLLLTCLRFTAIYLEVFVNKSHVLPSCFIMRQGSDMLNDISTKFLAYLHGRQF